MKNLAKVSVTLTVAILFATLIFAQDHVGAAFFLANDSQANTVFAQEVKQDIKEDNSTRPRVVEINDIKEESNETSTENSSEAKALKSEAMSFSATCYCLKGKTASGAMVRRGIVAADPRILPLGTRIQVSGSSHSGTYLVADTGGVVKGRIIDIWVPSCAEAIRFGRRKVTVTILGKGGKSAKKAKKASK
ncbi:MAG: 3D domain-containing protein [Pyrinomonadaceae bacterium]|nr:3D domain-containing protein [Pyrinomonadaceae bacterium]